MKYMLFAAIAVILTGCYSYSTDRTIKSGNKECVYKVTKNGNALLGYQESDWTNENRSEKDCIEFLK
ncbi:MAG: hypothetical protein FWG80_01385 [Alphaproteobacteria bacterium]|nr:hypothetical protein [Alphaproteobacteria bacterium]